MGLVSIVETRSLMLINPLVTLVVPMLNEAQVLHELLTGLANQTRKPNEIIFIDAGSTDGSIEIVNEWWRVHGWPCLGCRVVTSLGAYPGEARNVGIKESQGQWIAFIDAGIEPENNWLEQLLDHSKESSSEGVFGVCLFTADTFFQRVVCSLTSGYGAVIPVLPASIIKKEVFNIVGLFPKKFRAAEDLLWLSEYERHYGDRTVAWGAKVIYRHFPKNLTALAKKWRLAEYCCVLSGMRKKQRIIFLAILLLLLLSFNYNAMLGAILLFSYLTLRAVFFPIYRSVERSWWTSQLSAIPVAILTAIVIDISKLVGNIQGVLSAISLSRSRFKG